jgi:tripartite-type tricarboxylate transporter receptor subunit TctC
MKTRFAAALALALFAGAAPAQVYPTKTIRFVAPWPAAGVTDILSRALALAMSESLGQPVVVENRPGAGGTLGMAAVAKASPDGYTVAMTDLASHAISATLYPKLGYDVLKDFEAVSLFAASPMVLVAAPPSGVKTLPGLVDLARARPGQHSFASSGNGSITHLGIERLRRALGLELIHVPFKGTVPAITSVLGGETLIAFGTVNSVVPLARAGKLALLGVSLPRRFGQLPEVPAIAEHVPGFDMAFHTGMLAPARTPKEVVERLYAELGRALGQPKVREVFDSNGTEPLRLTPGQTRELLAREVRAWGEIVKATGVTVD